MAASGDRSNFKVLGVDRGADADAIKRAFRKLARQHHPDVNPGDASAEERFKEISVAYEVLSDPDRRRRYEWSYQYQNQAARERAEAARKQEDLRKALERALAKHKGLAEREAKARSVLNEGGLPPAGKRVDSGAAHAANRGFLRWPPTCSLPPPACCPCCPSWACSSPPLPMFRLPPSHLGRCCMVH